LQRIEASPADHPTVIDQEVLQRNAQRFARKSRKQFVREQVVAAVVSGLVQHDLADAKRSKPIDGAIELRQRLNAGRGVESVRVQAHIAERHASMLERIALVLLRLRRLPKHSSENWKAALSWLEWAGRLRWRDVIVEPRDPDRRGCTVSATHQELALVA